MQRNALCQLQNALQPCTGSETISSSYLPLRLPNTHGCSEVPQHLGGSMASKPSRHPTALCESPTTQELLRQVSSSSLPDMRFQPEWRSTGRGAPSSNLECFSWVFTTTTMLLRYAAR